MWPHKEVPRIDETRRRFIDGDMPGFSSSIKMGASSKKFTGDNSADVKSNGFWKNRGFSDKFSDEYSKGWIEMYGDIIVKGQ